MAPKKDDVSTYTKAELIKALRASVAREAKLQKRIAKLEATKPTTDAEFAACNDPPKPDAQFIADVDEGARLALHGDLEPEDQADEYLAGIQAKTAFPWEKK